jgi:hypothetical protein
VLPFESVLSSKSEIFVFSPRRVTEPSAQKIIAVEVARVLIRSSVLRALRSHSRNVFLLSSLLTMVVPFVHRT